MKKNILIATGIYPPDIGGPAEYAAELEKVWKNQGYKVTVKYFSFEKKLPTGIRHIFFALKSIPAVISADFILVLDTWSAAIPTAFLCRIFGQKFVIRTGGDFLWESYLERTKKKVLFKNFYNTELDNLNSKEKIIFKKTKWVLNQAEKIVFSTSWQRNIWQEPYKINIAKTTIIENFYGEKEVVSESKDKIFIGAARPIYFKSVDNLKQIFDTEEIKKSGFALDLKTSSKKELLDRIKKSYAVVLASLGDISPNLILDAIKLDKPFIVTEETGIKDRIKDVAIFVNPLDKQDIIEKVLWLMDENNYKAQQEKLAKFSFVHTWDQIADEFLNLKI